MSLLETFIALKHRLASGQDCDDLLANLSLHLNRFRPMLRRAFRGVLEEEDEIVSTVSTKIWRGVSGFQGQTEGEAFNYCRTIVQREIVNHVRAVRRVGGHFSFRGGKAMPTASALESGAEGGDGPDDLATSAEELADSASAREEFGVIVRALGKLPPMERDILWLNLIEGVQIAEIARRSGKTEAAVSQRKARALAKLRQILPARMAEGRHRVKTRPGRGTKLRQRSATEAATSGVDNKPVRKRRTARR